MKIGLTICVLLTTLIGECQTSGDTIIWEPRATRMLQIVDFKGTPDVDPKYSASSKIIRPTKWYTSNDSLFIHMYAAFVCSRSWIKRQDTNRDSTLVDHEQGHFDLAELSVRQTRKRFQEDSLKLTRENFKEIITRYVSEQTQMFDELNRSYERETGYSRNV